ncbi:Ig-like V-type domain-containing protein FAM187A [Mya arenaria]|uniref:Ig-like V-type domain-containing protein FAM187A n=1 Tax=Mya arenaria TaxID=6604 RepID=UPI0022E58419|nr:Ig-like V-type domain-containing protein FAM187A [Mya arenaria]
MAKNCRLAFLLQSSFVVCLFTCVKCYEVDVTVMDDGQIVDVAKFDIIDGDVPPFETPHDHWKVSSILATKDAGSAGRMKRSGVSTLPIATAAPYDVCIDVNGKAGNGKQAMNIERGRTLRLPCHKCDVNGDDKFAPMQWVKLSYAPGATGLYHIHELVPDLYSDEKRNRISTAIDHTLFIKRARLSDAGTYFCTPTENKSFTDMWLPWVELKEYILRELHLQFYFHVDVIDLNEAAIIDVSSGLNNSAREPEVIEARNIAVVTNWQPWTSCSVCGDVGMRKRVGLCTVRKHDVRYMVDDKYIEHVLKLGGKDGIPCQSQMLAELAAEKFMQRPNEMQMEECHVPCTSAKSMRSRRSISKSEIRAEPDKRKLKGKVKKVKSIEGTYLVLVCPGSGLSKTVVWVNGTALLPTMQLRKLTNNRITFDLLGNMHFVSVAANDTGVYSCWIKNKLKQRFIVTESSETLKVKKKEDSG